MNRRAFHGEFTMTKEQDEQQFFKDLGATAEQTVEEVRGAEENYFVLIQRMFSAFPGVSDLNNKLQTMPNRTSQMRSTFLTH